MLRSNLKVSLARREIFLGDVRKAFDFLSFARKRITFPKILAGYFMLINKFHLLGLKFAGAPVVEQGAIHVYGCTHPCPMPAARWESRERLHNV